jgi:glycosyltransferase involved in cell wall biosynthesis
MSTLGGDSARHIVFVAPFGLRRKTTVWARTLPLAEHLVALGHTATILIPPWDSPETAGTCEQQNGVTLEQVRLTGGPAAILQRLLARISQLQPAVVQIVKPRAYAGLVQFWLWQRRNGHRWRIVLDVDDWEQAWASINRYSWPMARFLAWQEEWGFRHAHGITAASRWLMDAASRAAPSIPRLYLPNGVTRLLQPALRPPPDPAGPPRILFFSRFVEVDPEWLAAFWAAVWTELPTAELIIAGEPVQSWLAEPFRAALAGAPRVQWAGYVSRDHLPGLYASATCAIFPADPIPLHQAKCSVRLATTLLNGVPVIASAVGEQSYYGADGAASLVAAGATPQEFAAAVVQVLRQPAARALLRARAEEHLLRRYAWSGLADHLARFYADLLGDPHD